MKAFCLLTLFLVLISFNGGSGQRTSERNDEEEEEANPMLDMASMFIQEALSNQGGNDGSVGGVGGAGAGLAGIASLIGTFVQANNVGGADTQSKSTASGAMQILSGIGSLLANSGSTNSNPSRFAGGGGLDPSVIGNVIEIISTAFAGGDSDGNSRGRAAPQPDSNAGLPLNSLLQLASAFINTNSNGNTQKAARGNQQRKRSIDDEYDGTKVDNAEPQENGLLSFLPLIMQAVSSFAGPEGQQTQQKHKDHAWVLPPFLEHLHVVWDHFSNSELSDALYKKSGIHQIFKGFRGRDGKVDYDSLLESLNNQSFRRRWIKSATLYFADWASYLAQPEVYLKYFQTAELMFNGFLKTQGYPKSTFFDPSRATETISNLLDHVAKHHLSVKIDSRQYVKPAVGYAKALLKLGQARGLLQFNATELSDKLTDTLNLEVIEPILKVHRAYRFIAKTPHCDRYVLCELNSVEQNASEQSRALISGVSPKIVKVGSMAAAIFISTETGTPFWTLFEVINSPYKCDVKYPVDCTGFHEGEAKVTTEYIHNEL